MVGTDRKYVSAHLEEKEYVRKELDKAKDTKYWYAIWPVMRK